MQHFLDLDHEGKVQATYIWLDSTKNDVRAKTKTLDSTSLH